MARLRRLAWLALALCVGAGSLGAANFGESRVFSAAAKAYTDQIWWLAETNFSQFVEQFPKSEQRPQAVLYQAIACYRQTNAPRAIDLLRANLDRAGVLADEYQYWIAESLFQKSDYTNAAEAYVELIRRYAGSRFRLAALIGEAASRVQLGDLAAVVARLGAADGEFAQARQTAITNELVVRGSLLLGEAQLARKNYAGVEQAVAPLRGQKLPPELAWRAERLGYEAQFVSDRFAEALTTSSNLVALANGRAELLSESKAMQAAALERLGRLDQARAIYESNLAPGTRADRQRQALLKLSELALAQGNFNEATNQLFRFLNLSSNEPAADAAMLALGELHLRRHVATNVTNPVAGAGDLEVALGLFNRLVSTFTNSDFFGKAELDRGWCFWLKTNQLAEAAAAFERATQRLPAETEDRVVAQVKLGDALFALKDYGRALTSYQQGATLLARWPKLHEALAGDIFLQVLRASLEVTNLAAADEAVTQIQKLPPRDNLAERALILRIQGPADAADPSRALADFERFLTIAPAAPMRPVVELVINAARERKGDWAGAVKGYEEWLVRFPTNELRPRAEFQLAWANWQAGRETNAYAGFTNFAHVYATNELAPQAQWWVADYFWRQGKYTEAEINYKTLVEKWKTSDLSYLARLKAGQAALGESRYDEAGNHFTNLTSDAKCPLDVWAQAAFAYGDMLMIQPPADTNRLANFILAIQVFRQIPLKLGSTTNEIAMLALGEVAKCLRQLGRSEWTNATNAFFQVANSPVVGVAARSEAQVGLAGLYADMAQTETGEEQVRLLREAVRNCLAVVYQENLREDRESANAFWIKRAGLDAGPLLERLGEFKQAEQLYRRLQDLLPPLRASLERKIEQLRERQPPAEKQ